MRFPQNGSGAKPRGLSFLQEKGHRGGAGLSSRRRISGFPLGGPGTPEIFWDFLGATVCLACAPRGKPCLLRRRPWPPTCLGRVRTNAQIGCPLSRANRKCVASCPKLRSRGAPRIQGHRSSASARRPTSVILTRATSIARPPATTRSVHVVAIPVLMRSTRKSTVNPCASMIASLQPSGDAASSSSARRRSGFGPRLRRE